MKKSKKNISVEQNENNNYISKLKEIFEYYCQYGERLNSRILKSHGFIKLFRESGLMDKRLDTTRLEIIYKSINKNNQMNFDQFLNSLIKIASYKYNLTEKKDIKNATQKIILEYLYPLNYKYVKNNNIFQSNNLNNNDNNIINSSEELNNLSFENIIYTDAFKQILIQVVPILFDIYRSYFTNEISISDNLTYIKKESMKNYFTLIKNFEIIPYLLSNSTCYQIYKYENNDKKADESIQNNQNFYFEICQKIDFLNMNTYEHSNKNIFGKYFIFFKFIRALIRMSQLTFDKIYNSNINFNEKLTPEEMFILFLQKIEQSEGFGNFTKINNSSHNYKTSNIIPPHFRIEFLTKKEKINEEKNNDNNNIIDIEINANYEEIIDINQNLEAYEPKYINYINEVYGKGLLNLYKTIVNFGDQFNFQYMKSKAFYKFLSDSNLIKNKRNNFGIKLNDIDIFFIKMCLLMKNNKKNISKKKNKNINNNTVNVSYGEIDYLTFIISIEILSRYLFSNLTIKQAIDKLITEYILKSNELIKNNKINDLEQKIENLKQLQNDEEIISFLQVIHKAFYPLFSFYTKDNDGLMSLHSFMKFTKDFEIFPYLIGKAKLNSLFNAIAQYSSFTKKNEYFIEHSLFVDLIALMALEMVYPEPEPSPVEKMLIFIEKISQSGGLGKMVMRTGNNRIANCANFIDVFKEIYPGYFGENEENYEVNDKDDFASFLKFNNDNNNDNNENVDLNDYGNIENNENIYENEDINNKIDKEKINGDEIQP
jgi:hypothetical protein